MIDELLKTSDWELLEEKMRTKMNELLIGLSEIKGNDYEDIATTALANAKAYRILNSFLEDINFFKQEKAYPVKRDYK